MLKFRSLEMKQEEMVQPVTVERFSLRTTALLAVDSSKLLVAAVKQKSTILGTLQ